MPTGDLSPIRKDPMELEHSFTVPAPADELWPTLLDVPRIASCLPGAAIDSSSGNEHTGGIKVKVGPITMTYRGTIRLTEADEASRRIVMAGNGRETGGAGTASATIEARLVPHGENETMVLVHTDFDVTGKPVQFGRGMIADVGRKLIDRFAAELAVVMTSPDSTTGSAAAQSRAGRETAAGLDFLSVASGPLLKRVGPALAGAVVVAVIIRRLIRR